MTWYALYCEPQREALAARMLAAIGGFHGRVFFPHVLECNDRGRQSTRAYYPRYLLIDAHDSETMTELCGLWLIPGVIGVVKGTSRMPHAVPGGMLQPLFDIADPLGAIHVQESPRSRYGLLRGNRVKLAEGSCLWGLVATVSEVDGLRASVVLHMLGADREVSVPVEFVGDGETLDNNRDCRSSDAMTFVA